ncbi:MAG: hypothetical protein ACLU6Y_16245 [Ruminococcus sp.]
MQVDIFRKAGRMAGEYFAKKMLNLDQPLDQFVSELQKKLEELKIGVLRIEDVDETSGELFLTVSEDADCSGLPILGETVCNYDEGFISGILSVYSGKGLHSSRGGLLGDWRPCLPFPRQCKRPRVTRSFLNGR